MAKTLAQTIQSTVLKVLALVLIVLALVLSELALWVMNSELSTLTIVTFSFARFFQPKNTDISLTENFPHCLALLLVPFVPHPHDI